MRKSLIIVSGLVAVLILLWTTAVVFFDKEKTTLNDEVRSSLPGQLAKLPNGVVHYQYVGPEDAPIVVLVHGFSTPSYIWDPTFDALIDAGFRVLRYDLYGRGYSDRPEVDYDLDLFTQQLEDLLASLNIDEPINLAGLSMGGPIAAKFSNQHPEKVRTLILIDPLTTTPSTRDIFPLNVPIVGEYIFVVYFGPFMLPQLQVNDFYQPERFPDWEDRYRVQMQYTGFRKAILSTIRNFMVDVDALAEYKAVGKRNLPVLLIWGREDQTIPSADMDKIRGVIPDVEFYTIDEAGHIPQYERPEVVGPLLIEFLKNE